jgi:hypothetical protein
MVMRGKNQTCWYKKSKRSEKEINNLETRLRRGMSGTVSRDELETLEAIAYNLDEVSKRELQARFRSRYNRLLKKEDLDE